VYTSIITITNSIN